MPRTNPQVQRLETENGLLRQQIDRMKKDPGDVPSFGCGHGCVCFTVMGMGTNGPCSCDERALRRAVQYWRMVANQRQAIIQDMRGDYARGYDDALARSVPSPGGQERARHDARA